MTRKRLTLIFLFTLAVLTLAPSPAAAQTACTGALSAAFTGPLDLNREGLTERPADFVIGGASATAPSCFDAGNSIRVIYNGTLTSPTTVTNTSVSNFVIVDPANTLRVNVTTTTAIGPGGPETVIIIDVLTGTTNATASITLKNLRFTVTTLGDNAVMNALVSSTVAGPLTPAATQVGWVRNTLQPVAACAALLAPAGPTAGPGCVTAVGTGKQSSGGGLSAQSSLTWASDTDWGTTAPNTLHSFRTAIVSSAVSGDIPTGATSVAFAVTNIPSSVTVDFPSTITISGQVKFTRRGAGSATGGDLAVVYDTTARNNASFTLVVDTKSGTGADIDTATVPNTTPDIGVSIGTNSGFGTASMRVVFGPGDGAAAFTGDDVSATAIPRYINSVGSTLGQSRRIVNTNAFFIITATRTVLIYPFVTNLFGFNTGISVANTGNDSTVFTTPTVGQTGRITLFFFPTGGTPFSFSPSTSTVGRGLAADGSLAPGRVFAASLDALLTAAGQATLIGSFDGYVIAVCQFDFGHGFALVFTPAGQITTSDALVLGSGTRIGAAGVPEILAR